MSKENTMDALRFKEEMQRKVQDELADLSTEEQIKRIRQMAEEGNLREWWKRARSGRSKRCA